MNCTGHKSYNTIKPYIETATETAALEMEKWNKNQYRSKIINLLDDVDETFLKELLSDKQKGLISLKNLIGIAMALGYTSELKAIFSQPKYSTMEELTQIRKNQNKKKAHRV